jgi:hypothetical protein
MSIKFKTVVRKNLLNPTAEPKNYAIAARQGKIDIDRLSHLIDIL